MQYRNQYSNKLPKLILTTYFLCLPLLACNNQQQISKDNQISAPAEPQTKSTPKPLSLQTSPQDNNYFLDNQIWGENGDKQNLLTAIDYSLSYLQTTEAKTAYQKYIVPEITQEKVEKSLKRFRELVVNSQTAEELQEAVNKELVFY